MQKTALVYVAAIVLGLFLLALSGGWYYTGCLPFEVHTFKWQCEMQFPFLGLSFALPGALFGFLVPRHPWLGGAMVALAIILIAVVFTDLLRPYYGSNIFAAVVSAFFFAVFPSVLASVGAFFIRGVNREQNSL